MMQKQEMKLRFFFCGITIIIIGYVIQASAPREGLTVEKANKEAEQFKEMITDQDMYDAESLRGIKETLQQSKKQAGLSFVEQELINAKLAAVDHELLTRVTYNPPAKPVSDNPRETKIDIERGEVGFTVGELSGQLTDLSVNINKNSSEITKLLDRVDQKIENVNASASFDEQLEDYNNLVNLSSSLQMVKNAALQSEKGFQKRISLTDTQVTRALTKMVDSILEGQIQQIRDARLRVGPTTLWTLLGDALRSLLSFFGKTFKKELTLRQDITRVTELVKQLEAKKQDAQNRVHKIQLIYQSFIDQLTPFLAQDIDSKSVGELQNMRAQLTTIELTNATHGKEFNDALQELTTQFGSDITQLSQVAWSALTPWQLRIKSPRYPSLYAQFKELYIKNFNLDANNYSLQQEKGKSWVPEALGFSSYSDMLQASDATITSRFKDISAQQPNTPLFNIARELSNILSDPISRDNFRALLSADGLLDGTVRGEGVVNALELPDVIAKPLYNLSMILTSQISQGIISSLPDFSPTQIKILQKIQAIDQRLDVLLKKEKAE